MKKNEKQEVVKGSVQFQIDAELRAPIVGLILSKDEFVVSMPNGVRDRILKHMEELKEKRLDWPSYMYKELEKRMRFTGINLRIEEVRMNDVLVMIGEKFVLITGFDTVSKQKTIDEAI